MKSAPEQQRSDLSRVMSKLEQEHLSGEQA